MKNSLHLALEFADDMKRRMKVDVNSSESVEQPERNKVFATRSVIRKRRFDLTLTDSASKKPKSAAKADLTKVDDKVITVDTPVCTTAPKINGNPLNDLSLPFAGFEPGEQQTANVDNNSENTTTEEVPVLEGASPPKKKERVVPERIQVNDDVVLEAAVRTKRVFVGRIKGDVSSDIIRTYLASKLPEKSSFRVDKVNSKHPRNSSFIVHTNEDEELFKEVMNKKIWPAGVVVQEHFRRRKPRKIVN